MIVHFIFYIFTTNEEKWYRWYCKQCIKQDIFRVCMYMWFLVMFMISALDMTFLVWIMSHVCTVNRLLQSPVSSWHYCIFLHSLSVPRQLVPKFGSLNYSHSFWESGIVEWLIWWFWLRVAYTAAVKVAYGQSICSQVTVVQCWRGAGGYVPSQVDLSTGCWVSLCHTGWPPSEWSKEQVMKEAMLFLSVLGRLHSIISIKSYF